MTTRDQLDRIRRALAAPAARLPASEAGAPPQQAAVLVPLFECERDLHVLFIRRSDSVESHRGQVAFPGGRFEASDPDLLAAALREAQEEVGIHPDTVDVLGGFPTMSTLSSGIMVAPYVGVIPPPERLKADPREVAEIFDVPMRALGDPRYRGQFRWGRDGRAGEFPAIFYGGQTIWGLTYRITLSLLEIVAGTAA